MTMWRRKGGNPPPSPSQRPSCLQIAWARSAFRPIFPYHSPSVYVYVRLPVCLPFLPTIFRSVHSGPLPYTSAPRSGTLLSLVLRMGARGGPFSFPCPAAAAGPSSVAVSGGKFKLLLVNGTPRKVWGRSLGVGTVRSPSFRDYSGSRGAIFCSCYCCHSAAPDELFAPDNAQPVSSVTCCHTFLNARRNTVHFAG